MICFKCRKEMDREDGGPTLIGADIKVSPAAECRAHGIDTIEYFNRQLGKYSDGTGSRHVVICFECYIDGLLNKIV